MFPKFYHRFFCPKNLTRFSHIDLLLVPSNCFSSYSIGPLTPCSENRRKAQQKKNAIAAYNSLLEWKLGRYLRVVTALMGCFVGWSSNVMCELVCQNDQRACKMLSSRHGNEGSNPVASSIRAFWARFSALLTVQTGHSTGKRKAQVAFERRYEDI